MDRRKLELEPYHRFTRAEWSELRADEPMTLSAEDIRRLVGQMALDNLIFFNRQEGVLPPLLPYV